MNSTLNEIIEYLLKNMKDPFPQYIIKKEILDLPVDISISSCIRESKWYQQLESEQLEDGSWGRFHSMDPSITKKQVFRTTEEALRRTQELSIRKDDPIIQKSIRLLERYLKGEDTWRDRVEKHNDNGKSFCHSITYITAANLCRLDPDNPLLMAPRQVCAKQLEAAFSTGLYDDAVWKKVNLDYSGTCLDAF